MRIKRSIVESLVLHVTYEPGNGTKYEAIAMRSLPRLAPSSWLIYFPLLGVAAEFNDGSFVSHDYVTKKLGLDATISMADIHEMCKMIAHITGARTPRKPKTPGSPALRIAR